MRYSIMLKEYDHTGHRLKVLTVAQAIKSKFHIKSSTNCCSLELKWTITEKKHVCQHFL